MNILVFTTAFYPSVGGLENQTFNILDEFIKAGHNIKVITFQAPHAAEHVEESKEKRFNIYYNPRYSKVFSLFFWCNVFYMPNFSLKGSWFVLFRPFKKWVISHNDLYLSNKKDFKVRLKRLLIKLASKNIAVSNCVATYIDTSAVIIYNCYDNDIFKIYKDEQRKYEFVFLGRLVSQKGCAMLIEACRNLKTDFTLNIIGDGPERSIVEKMVREYELEDRVHFLGILEGEILARTLNNHHCMIIPSLSEEGFGIVALEGMACGCNIIAADAGGLAEAVKSFGKLFKMGSVTELAALLQKQIEELDFPLSSCKNEDLKSYLAQQSKKAVAVKYLSVFSDQPSHA